MPGKLMWRGKNRTHITVGQGPGFDHSNPQSAWDAITDSAAEKPYLISLDSGIYEQNSPSAGEPAWWFKDKSDISIVGPRSAVLKKTGTTGGGTVAIGEDGNLAERIRLSGFTIVNPLNGNPDGDSPEAALNIGTEEEFPTTLPYNDVEIEGLHILGSDAALVLNGTIAPGTDGGPTTPPRLFVRNNLIETCHIAYLIGGGLQLQSCGNQLFVKSDGITPWLTDINNDVQASALVFDFLKGFSASTDRGLSYYVFTGDQIHSYRNGNTPSAPGKERIHSGISFYVSSGTTGLGYPDVSFTGCPIKVINITGTNIASGMSGINMVCEAITIADGDIVYSN